MQKKLRKWAILALLLVLFISHTVAANATTGDPDYTAYTYHALIDALDNAEAGDIIGIMDTIIVSNPAELVFSKGDMAARVTLKRMSSDAQIIFRDEGYGGGCIVEKLRFNGNSAEVSGNSAFVRVESKVNFEKCEFIKCSDRSNSGGAMIVPNGGEAYLSNCSFSGNVASTGAQIWNAGTVELNYCTLSGGEAIHNGGGVYNYGGTLIMTETEIRDGRAKRGAGVYNMGSVEINNSLIWNNTANVQGDDIVNSGILTDNTTEDEYKSWLEGYDLYYVGWESDRVTESFDGDEISEEYLKLVYSYDKPTPTPEPTPEPVDPDPTPTPDPEDGGEGGGSEGDDPANKPVDPEPTDPPVTPEPTDPQEPTNPDEGENDPTVTPTPTEPSNPSEDDNTEDKGNTSDNSGAGSNTGENGSSEKPTEPPTGDNEQVPPNTDNSNTEPEGKDPDPTLTPADNKPEPSPSTPDKTDQSGSGDGNDKPTGDNSSNKPSSGGNTATDNNQSSNNGSHSTVNNSSSKSESIKTENSNNTSTVNNYYTQDNPQKEEVVTAQSIPAPVRDTPTVVNVPESRSNEVSLIGQSSAHTDTGQSPQQNIKIDAKGVDLIYEYTANGVSISISSERATESPAEALSISQLSNPTEPPETPQAAQNSPNLVEIITMILLAVLVLGELRDRFKKTE